MIVIKGKYGYARIFTDEIEETAMSQIYKVLNHPAFQGSSIAIMPDVHAGAGCVIGFTQTLNANSSIIANLIGVDIGCGMLAMNIGKVDIDFEKFDVDIRRSIPSGFNVRDTNHWLATDDETISKIANSKLYTVSTESIKVLADKTDTNVNRAFKSIGTLGGGNHFIEVGEAPDGCKWIVIHSGSRNLGKNTCDYHQNKAKKLMQNTYLDKLSDVKTGSIRYAIKELEKNNSDNSMIDELREMVKAKFDIKNLEFLPVGLGREQYEDDMIIAQTYASMNRYAMLDEICRHIWYNCITEDEQNQVGLHHTNHPWTGLWMDKEWKIIESVHNFIDFEDNILRKGATPARGGQRVIIPFNMRDGIAICTGKGNKNWNYSAPHGAGRIMSRSKAKEQVTLEEYEASMDGVFTTCVNTKTIDESPMAYKDHNMILEAIKDTVTVDFMLKPIYNFKGY